MFLPSQDEYSLLHDSVKQLHVLFSCSGRHEHDSPPAGVGVSARGCYRGCKRYVNGCEDFYVDNDRTRLRKCLCDSVRLEDVNTQSVDVCVLIREGLISPTPEGSVRPPGPVAMEIRAVTDISWPLSPQQG